MDVSNEFCRCERLGKAVFPLEPERHTVQPVKLEPARITPENGRREPAFPLGVPHDFTDGIPLAHGVENVLYSLGKNAGIEKIPHKIGGLHVFGIIGCGLHLHGKPGNLELSGG